MKELRSRYGRAVARACRPFAGTEVDDCAQEVFTRVWDKAHLYDRGRGSVAAWLLTVARNTAVNFQRERKAPPLVAHHDDDGTVGPPDVDRLWLEEALARLPEPERRVIELGYFADLTQGQIAAHLGAPLGTVKSWTRRALMHLAAELEERG
jgi:RNA polymerase sigma-70 factor (ECF subfamily)